MRIGIDGHVLGTRAGGNETFIRQLLLGIRETAPDTDVVVYVGPGLHDTRGAAGFPTHTLTTRSSWLRVPFALPRAVSDTRPDLLHVQYIAPPRCPCPFIVTLHDVVWKRLPKTLRAIDRYRLAALAPGTLHRAARIFVVSEAMKREAIEFYRVDEAKIDVVHNSVDPVYRPMNDRGAIEAVRSKYELPKEYVAYVGALQPRKNVVRLAQAFARLKRDGLPHALVLAGGRGWKSGPILKALAETGLGDALILPGYVDFADLPVLIAAADAFAYVSLYEGFGLPVAEAMACGTPVLTSTDPALCEVAGDAAVACDPLDPDAIEEGLSRILTDTDLRSRLKMAGPIRARTFSREKMARAALEGYAKALEQA